VPDVAQLQALLAKTFDVGLDVARGKEPVAFVRLRLAKALIGVAEANALAAESIAIERGVGPQQIAQTEALALHAAAFKRDAGPRWAEPVGGPARPESTRSARLRQPGSWGSSESAP